MRQLSQAEMTAIRAACRHLNNYRHGGTTLYVTLEPCTMCIGALIHARRHRLVYATNEPRAGTVGSQTNLSTQPLQSSDTSTTRAMPRVQQSITKSIFSSAPTGVKS